MHLASLPLYRLLYVGRSKTSLIIVHLLFHRHHLNLQDDQRRKGRGQGEFRKYAGSSESERKLRGGEYIHDHGHLILNTRSVLYAWPLEDIVAESNRGCKLGHRGIQIEIKAQNVEEGQVMRPAGGQERRGARLAVGNTEPGTETQHTERGIQCNAGHKTGTQVSIVHDTDRTRRNEANEQANASLGRAVRLQLGQHGTGLGARARTIHLTPS
jgi:hypothetical protein